MGMELSWKKEIMGLLRNRGKKYPLGLRNPSNSCYVNSVLQCLTHTPPLANYCLQRKHLSKCRSDNKAECPMCLLEDRIVRSLSEAQVDSEAPNTINSNLRIFGDYLSPHVQTDAHEFLDCVINACKECEKSNMDDNFLNKMFQSVMKSIKSCVEFLDCVIDAWQQCEKSNKDDSFWNEMFQVVKSKISTCVECGNSSHSEEIQTYFPVPISQPDGSFTEPHIVIDLNESLGRYFNKEYVEASSPCEKCNSVSSCLIEPSISKPPNVLILTLQRFWVDNKCFRNTKKIFNSVLFPESLSLTQYLTSSTPGEDYVYSLYAIIVHQGAMMDCGHYIAYVKDAHSSWFQCNDDTVNRVTIQHVLQQQQNVYMLFYIRQTAPQRNISNTYKRGFSQSSMPPPTVRRRNDRI